MPTDLQRETADLRTQDGAEAKLAVPCQRLAERIDVKSHDLAGAAFESTGIAELLQKTSCVALGYSHAHVCLGRKVIVHAGRLDTNGAGHIARAERIKA